MREYIFFADNPDSLGSFSPNGIIVKKVPAFFQSSLDILDLFFDHLPESDRNIFPKPAFHEIRRHHPRAGAGFVDVHYLFALAERIEENRYRPDIHRVRAKPQKMRLQPRQLHQNDPCDLRVLGYLYSHNLLDRPDIRHVVHHRGHVIDTVEQHDRLMIIFFFAGFLNSRVQIPDHRLAARDNLAVKLKDKPEHAMGRGCCGPMLSV